MPYKSHMAGKQKKKSLFQKPESTDKKEQVITEKTGDSTSTTATQELLDHGMTKTSTGEDTPRQQEQVLLDFK